MSLFQIALGLLPFGSIVEAMMRIADAKNEAMYVETSELHSLQNETTEKQNEGNDKCRVG